MIQDKDGAREGDGATRGFDIETLVQMTYCKIGMNRNRPMRIVYNHTVVQLSPSTVPIALPSDFTAAGYNRVQWLVCYRCDHNTLLCDICNDMQIVRHPQIPLYELNTVFLLLAVSHTTPFPMICHGKSVLLDKSSIMTASYLSGHSGLI